MLFKKASISTQNQLLISLKKKSDDGLACFGNIKGSQAERIRKEFMSIFKIKFKLITSKTNLNIVNFLGVILNLNTGSHQPYKKPDNNFYIKKYTKKNKHAIKQYQNLQQF